MANIAVQEQNALARPLKVLVPLIKEELNDAYESGIDHFRRSGELLQEARFQVKRQGESWSVWLRRNFRLSKTTAHSYMNLAGEMEFREAVEESQSTQSDTGYSGGVHAQRHDSKPVRSMRSVLRPGEKSRARWYEPVRQVVNRVDLAKIRREYEDKIKDNKVTRDLARQLIDIGYKVLATKLHPDKGGSSEAMHRLNEIRLSLKQCAEDKWDQK